MIFLDATLAGWYFLLGKTVYYLSKKSSESWGPKQHAFFISFALHSLNLWTIVRLALVKFSAVHLQESLGIILTVLTFLGGYNIYFQNKRAHRILNKPTRPKTIILLISVAIAYCCVTIYGVAKATDIVRSAQFHIVDAIIK